MSRPRQHHYVPQTYLKQFYVRGHFYAVNIKKVRDSGKSKVRLRYAAQVCYALDYYTITDECRAAFNELNNFDDLSIERSVLTGLENEYPMLLTDLLAHDPLPLSTAQKVIDFIMQTKFRNPYMLENTMKPRKGEWLDTSFSSIVSSDEFQRKYPSIPIELKHWLAEAAKARYMENDSFSRAQQLAGLTRRATESAQGSGSTYRDILGNCTWQVVTAPPGGPYFITSDNPGFCIGDDSKFYNTKFKGQFILCFPLSATACLLISHEPEPPYLDGGQLVKQVPKNAAPAHFVLFLNDGAIQVTNGTLISPTEDYLNAVVRLNIPKAS